MGLILTLKDLFCKSDSTVVKFRVNILFSPYAKVFMMNSESS